MANSRLFQPMKIGNMEVKHRIGMAPLTRLRATADNVPTPLMKEYYSQRASVPGTLIISEGTFSSKAASAGGFPNAPGIWNVEQIEAWRPITAEVHRKGCYIFCQIFATGRTGNVEAAVKEGLDIVGPSAIAIEDGAPPPRPMTVTEIRQSIQDFAAAAKNAISAGFDGVECHGANGYLVDEFTQDVSNQRNDEYGGSVENRSRYIYEFIKTVVDSIGAERVGMRLSPWNRFQGMGMDDPIPQFTDIIVKANQLNLAYLHLIESRIAGAEDGEGTERLDFAYRLWRGPLLVAGGYTLTEAQSLVDEEQPGREIVVVFGRKFLANPDLPFRMKEGLELHAPERSTFYLLQSPTGYIDYPFSPQYLAGL